MVKFFLPIFLIVPIKFNFFPKKKISPDQFKLVSFIDIGDIVTATGTVITTKSGEITIDVSSFQILAKSIRPLPEKWHGLKDVEERFRKRYLDLMMNKETREIFKKRSQVIKDIRNFLDENKFVEVETPILQSLYGGASAKPFKTHLNALDMDLYLRIALELYLKRLLVGGMERVYEIGRCFRNEGMDAEHLQDYTQMEFYWAYADYTDMMKLVEDLYREVAQATFGTMQFKVKGFDVDLGKDWGRIEYVAEIEKQQGLNVIESSAQDVMKKLDDLEVKYDKKLGKWRLVDLLWKQCRKKHWWSGFCYKSAS